VKTKCPVSDVVMAVRIVLRSHDSPMSMTPGSCLKAETKASLKLGASIPTCR
jgi:hypothetical protein